MSGAPTKTSGVYAICCTLNERRYVGSSANVSKRWSRHRHMLRRGKHHSPHLQNAWNKYGEDAFEFVVLEECPVETLIEREQWHMDQCSDKYNCAPITGTRRGVPTSPATRAKLSAALMGNRNALGHVHTPETRAKMSAARMGSTNNAGNVASPETRSKLSAAKMGNTHCVGRKLSDETRAKISAAVKNQWERRRAG